MQEAMSTSLPRKTGLDVVVNTIMSNSNPLLALAKVDNLFPSGMYEL